MNDNDKKTTERDKALGDFLAEHARTGAVSFHMPGHKGAGFYEKNGFGTEMKRLADWDITEIAGADNLFQPETVIRRTMQKYERLYQTRRSYLLINGSSAGIIASILAAVPRGGRLLMARNCHKSVFNALYLGDIQPLYLHPQTDERYGVAGEVRASDVAALLERGRVRVDDVYSEKTGKRFSTDLLLADDGVRSSYRFDFGKEGTK